MAHVFNILECHFVNLTNTNQTFDKLYALFLFSKLDFVGIFFSAQYLIDNLRRVNAFFVSISIFCLDILY